MNHFPGDISATDFLERYWQKEPLLSSSAVPEAEGAIGLTDLVALACEPETESRIVIQDADTGTWQCEYGPFEAERFNSLPDCGWTLLVQAVDQWVPAVSRILQNFEFLPRWRLDDVMISYATAGASVGPHFDYYDVFLLQSSGTRCWQLGQRCDALTPLREHPDMKLLRDFSPVNEFLLGPTDMLYVPSGLSHWGTASGGDCITLSIGFRAPSHRDIIRGAVEEITAAFAEDDFYRDAAGAFDSDRWCINRVVVESLIPAWERLGQGPISEFLARTFGEQVTEPRNPDAVFSPDGFSEGSVMKQLEGPGPLAVAHHPASRFAYRNLEIHGPGTGAELYVDGQAYITTPALARGICHGEIRQQALAGTGERKLLAELLSQGSLNLPRNPR